MTSACKFETHPKEKLKSLCVIAMRGHPLGETAADPPHFLSLLSYDDFALNNHPICHPLVYHKPSNSLVQMGLEERETLKIWARRLLDQFLLHSGSEQTPFGTTMSKHNGDEVVVQLDVENGKLEAAPIDMAARLCYICKWYLIIYLVCCCGCSCDPISTRFDASIPFIVGLLI